MKKYRQKEWDGKKTEIIDKINSEADYTFNLDNFKSQIKRNIPRNCSNAERVIAALGDVKQGSIVIINDNLISSEPKPKKLKEDLVEILELIEIKWFSTIKDVINSIRKKVDGKWLVGTVLVIIGLLVRIYYK